MCTCHSVLLVICPKKKTEQLIKNGNIVHLEVTVEEVYIYEFGKTHQIMHLKYVLLL
jgi:hypothetical protein